MSKNKPMSRIDLDYRKNLKYPDINDYLNDTRYASNLTEFPDNQLGAVTAFKLVPGTTVPNRRITITPGYTWPVFLGTFKLYGYNPDLEAIERMVLTVDFVNNGDETLNYKKNVRRRNTDVLYDVIGPSDPKSLPLVGAVNYSIDFSPTALESIYNYVFDTQWVEASEHYQDVVYSDIPGTDSDAARKFRNYVKYRIYTLKIPVTVEYYYVNATEPGGVLKFTMTLRELLPTYRNKIDFDSKEITLNPTATATDNKFFKLSFTTNSLGEIQLGGYIEGKESAKEISPDKDEIATSGKSSLTTSMLARQLFINQHSGYDVSYPYVKFTYDFYIGVDKYLILNNEEFDRFEPVTTQRVINPITIQSYRYGHDLKKVPLSAHLKENPFKLVIDFYCQNANLGKDQHNTKFQVQFRDKKPGTANTPEDQPILTESSLEALLLAGSINADTPGLRTVQGEGSVSEKNVYRSNSTKPNSIVVQMASQRVNDKTNDLFKAAELSQFRSTLDFIETKGRDSYYRLTLTWPQNTKIVGLYIMLKSQWIVLLIGDAAQQVYLRGVIEKPLWNQIRTDAQNPAYNPNYFNQPKFIIDGLSSSAGLTELRNSAKEPERDRINGTPVNPSSYADLVQVGDNTKVLRLVSSDMKSGGKKTLTFRVQDYVSNGRDFYKEFLSPFVMMNAYVMLAHKITPAQNYTYLQMTGLRGNPPIKYRDYLQNYSVGTDAATIVLSIDPAEFTKMLEVSTGKKPGKLAKGEYKVYIMPNLQKIENPGNLNLYTSSFLNNSLKYFTELLIEYSWRVT